MLSNYSSQIQAAKHLLLGGLIGSSITCMVGYVFVFRNQKLSVTDQNTINSITSLKSDITGTVLPKIERLERRISELSESKAEKSQLDQFKQEFIKMHEELERDQRSAAKKASVVAQNEGSRRPGNQKEMVSM